MARPIVSPNVSHLTAFLQSRLSANCRASTLVNYRRTLSRFLKDTAELSPASVRAHIAKLREGNLKSSTLAACRASVVTFLTWLSDEGLIPPEQWQKRIPRVKQDQARPYCLSPDDVKRFLSAASLMPHSTALAAKRDIAMLYLLLDTGLREGELVNVRVDDVDLYERKITISAACKGRREREVWYGDTTHRRLRAYLKVRPSCHSPFLFLTREGDRPSEGLVLQIVKKIARRAGLPRVTVHALRHTATTMLLRNGMGVMQVMQILGHSRVDTTQRYAHLLNSDLAEQYRGASPMDRL